VVDAMPLVDITGPRWIGRPWQRTHWFQIPLPKHVDVAELPVQLVKQTSAAFGAFVVAVDAAIAVAAGGSSAACAGAAETIAAAAAATARAASLDHRSLSLYIVLYLLVHSLSCTEPARAQCPAADRRPPPTLPIQFSHALRLVSGS
jgi:hypothetical protein